MRKYKKNRNLDIENKRVGETRPLIITNSFQLDFGRDSAEGKS